MRRLAVGLALLVAAGCVTASVQHLSPDRYAPIPIEDVTVFLDIRELTVDTLAYERLAIIHLKGSQEFTDQEDIFKKAREEAAKLGANGVLFGAVEEGRTTWNALTGTTTSDRQGQAFAIQWWVVEPEEHQAEQADLGVAQVVISPPVDTLTVGEQLQLTATAHSSDGAAITAEFSWTSSNDAIASVRFGLVTVHANGEVVIAANADGVVGTARIVVLPN